MFEGARGGLAGGDIVGMTHDVVEYSGGDFEGALLFEVVAASDAEEGFANFWVGGEDGSERGELGGAATVLQGVEVAFGRAGVGAGTAVATINPFGTAQGRLRWTQIRRRLTQRFLDGVVAGV